MNYTADINLIEENLAGFKKLLKKDGKVPGGCKIEVLENELFYYDKDDKDILLATSSLETDPMDLIGNFIHKFSILRKQYCEVIGDAIDDAGYICLDFFSTPQENEEWEWEND